MDREATDDNTMFEQSTWEGDVKSKIELDNTTALFKVCHDVYIVKT